MPEPTSQAIGGIAVAAGAITITGSLFGLEYDALLAGLFGGLVALMHLEPMTRCRMAALLAGAAVTGAFFAPVASVAAVNYFPYLQTVGAEGLRLALAFVAGVLAQVAVPSAMRFLKRKADGVGGA